MSHAVSSKTIASYRCTIECIVSYSIYQCHLLSSKGKGI